MKSPYLPVAIDAVKKAEELILGYFQTDLTIETKADHTPVTVADRRAEELIKDTIRQTFPKHTFYGEEGQKADLRNHKGYTWIIDPIDGTKSFVRGQPLFGTLLALLHDGEVIVGVSNVPLLQELMYAAAGEGAFLNGRQVQVSDVAAIPDAYLSTGRITYFERLGLVPQLLQLAGAAKWARGIGDLWIYHLIAQGKADIMVEGSVQFWDLAAVKLIVEEAGGTFTQIDGQPITPKSTNCIASNGRLHDAVVTAFAPRGSQ